MANWWDDPRYAAPAPALTGLAAVSPQPEPVAALPAPRSPFDPPTDEERNRYFASLPAALPAAPTPAPTPPESAGVWTTLKDIGKAGLEMARGVPGVVAQQMEGVGNPYATRDWKDRWIEENQQRQQQNLQELRAQGEYDRPMGLGIPFTRGEFSQWSQSLPQTLATMGPALAGSALGTVAGGALGTLGGPAAGATVPAGAAAGRTIGSFLGGMAGAYLPAGGAAANQFIRDSLGKYQQDFQAKTGRAPTPEEVDVYYRTTVEPQAGRVYHGEALPEAVGTVAELGLMKSAAGEFLHGGGSLPMRALRAGAKTALSAFGVEPATEAITQQIQQPAYAATGLTDEAPRSMTSLEDWAKSYGEVFKSAAATSLFMSALGVPISAGYQRYQQRQEGAARIAAAEQATAPLRAQLDFARPEEIEQALAGFDTIASQGTLPKAAAARLDQAKQQLLGELQLRATPDALAAPLDTPRGQAGYLGFAARADELSDDQLTEVAQRPLPPEATPEWRQAQQSYQQALQRRTDLNQVADHFQRQPAAIHSVATTLLEMTGGKPAMKAGYGSPEYNLASLADDALTRYRLAGEVLLRDHGETLGEKRRAKLEAATTLLHAEADRRAAGERRDPQAIRESEVAANIAALPEKRLDALLTGMPPDALERMATGLEARVATGLEPQLADRAQQIRQRAEQAKSAPAVESSDPAPVVAPAATAAAPTLQQEVASLNQQPTSAAAIAIPPSIQPLPTVVAALNQQTTVPPTQPGGLPSAQQIAQPGPLDGGGSPRPEVRQEGGRPPEGGQGIQRGRPEVGNPQEAQGQVIPAPLPTVARAPLPPAAVVPTSPAPAPGIPPRAVMPVPPPAPLPVPSTLPENANGQIQAKAQAEAAPLLKAETPPSKEGGVPAKQQSPASTKTIEETRRTLESYAQEQDKIAEDWSSRKYKDNQTQVELKGDGPSNKESLSIGTINERRKQKRIDEARHNANSIRQFAKKSQEEMLSEYEKIHSAVSGWAQEELNRLNLTREQAIVLELNDRLFSINSFGDDTPGRTLYRLLEPIRINNQQRQQADAEKIRIEKERMLADAEKDPDYFLKLFQSDQELKNILGIPTPPTPPAPAPQPTQKPAPTPKPKRPAIAPLDSETDDILAAIAKLGGLDRKEAERQGIDPADFARRGYRIHRVFTRGGRSFDAMAEALDQEGYPVTEDGRYTANALLDAVQRALGGEAVMAPQGLEATAQKNAEADFSRQESWVDDAINYEAAGFEELVASERITAQLMANASRDLGENQAEAIFEWVSIQQQDADPETFNTALQEAIDAVRQRESQAGRAEAGPPATRTPAAEGEQPLLAGYSREELAREQEAVTRAQAEQTAKEQAAARKEAADQAAKSFVLAGSNRPADLAMARGQEDLLAAKPTATRAELSAEMDRLIQSAKDRYLENHDAASWDEQTPRDWMNKAEKYRLDELSGLIQALPIPRRNTSQDRYALASTPVDLDRRYSRPTTPATITASFKALSDDATVQDLIDRSRLRVVARQAELPSHAGIPPGQRVAGWVDPKTGAVWLVAENISPEEIGGKLLHEISGHQERLGLDKPFSSGVRLLHGVVRLVGAEGLLGKPAFDDVVAQMERLRSTSKVVQAAFAEAEAAAKALGQSQAILPEERIAYLVDHLPELPLVKRFIAAIRAALYKMGFRVSLTEADVRALAVSALRQAAKTPLGGLEPGLAGAYATESSKALVKRFRDTGFISNNDVLAILGDYPAYLDTVAEYILSQHRKLVDGKVTPRDVAKAYLLTLASQRSDAINPALIQERTGFVVPERFIGQNGKVRPEEAMAAWLLSPDGKRALDSIETGVVDLTLWEPGLRVRDAFGANVPRRAFLERQYPANVKGTVQTVTREGDNLRELLAVTDRINAAKGESAKLDAALGGLTGIAGGKTGFIKHFIGLGDTPTVDAVELNTWLTGKGDINGVNSEAADAVREFTAKMKNPELAAAVVDRITMRFNQLKNKISLPSQYRDSRVYLHLLHHWLWDRAKGIETTHAGLYEAMLRAAQSREDLEAARQYAEVVARYTLPDGTKAPGWLKAPNGEPTNLTERQWVQTRTPNFITWFGDFINDPVNASKVVDENGEPKILYHSTLESFNEFKLYTDIGTHFGSISQAENRILDVAEKEFYLTDEYAKGTNIIPVFLKIKTPLLTADIGQHGDSVKLWNENNIQQAILEYDKDLFNSINNEIEIVEKTRYNFYGPELFRKSKNNINAINTIRNALLSAGYDGLTYINSIEGNIGERQAFVTFSPTQIKSAIGNTGAFSPVNPDIRYSLVQTAPKNSTSDELLARVQAGEVSELTPDEWAQVQRAFLGQAATVATGVNAPTFKEWFGQSKIVKRDGSPLVMYHGTPESFAEFDAKKAGASTTHPTASLGFFFTNDKAHARAKYGANVLEVYLAIEKPYRMTDADLRAIESLEDSKAFRQKLEARGYDGIVMPAETSTRYVAAFRPDQVKFTDNESYTRGVADMRFALAKPKPEILKNPSMAEALRFFNESDYREVRGLIDPKTGDWFLWDAGRATHAKIAEELGIDMGKNSQYRAANHWIYAKSPTDIKTIYQYQLPEVSNQRFALAKPRSGVAPPTETKVQALQRAIQDRFVRFQVVQDWLKKTGLDLSPAADVYGAEALLPKKTAARTEDAREQILKPLVQQAAARNWRLSGGDLIGAIADGQPLPATFQPTLGEYLHARHAPERNRQIAKINPRVPDGSGLTDAQANEIVARYRAMPAFADFARLADRFQAISQQTKTILLQSGIVAPEMVKAWDAAYQHYVPLKGGPEDRAQKTGTGPGISVAGAQKRALGHTLRDENVIENLWRNHERAIYLSEKQQVGRALKQLLLEANNEAIGTVGQPEKRAVLHQGWAHQVWIDGAPLGVFASYSDAKAAIAADSQITGRPVSRYGVRHQPTDPTVIYTSKPLLGDNEVALYENGRLIRLQLNDELLARAAKNLGVDAASGLLKAGQAFNRWLSKAYTGYNPEFLLTNVARDFTTGFINLTGQYGAGTAVKALRNYPKAVAALWRTVRGERDPLVERYRAAGGSTGAAYLSDLERIGTDIRRTFQDYQGARLTWQSGQKGAAVRVATSDLAWTVGRYIEKLNQIGENALRVATFQTLLDAGKIEAEAARAAGDVTVNFNRKGELTQTLGGLYLFFNPAVQGTKTMLDALTKGPHRAQALALAGGLTALALTLAELARGGDDDDEQRWKTLPGHVKDRNLILRVGKDSDQWITVPVPYGYGAFWSLGNVLSDLAHGEDQTKLGIRLASTLFEQFSPVGNPFAGDEMDSKNIVSLLPTALKPPVALALNRNELGRPVMPEAQPWNTAQPDSQRRWRATQGTIYDRIASGLNALTGGNAYQAGAVDVSPETLKYLTRTAFGGSGQFAADVVNLGVVAGQGAVGATEIREWPIVRRFVRADSIQDSRTLFAEQSQKVRQATDAFGAARRAGDVAGMREIAADNREMLALGKVLDAARQAVKQRRALEDAINRADLPLAEKRQKLKAVEQQEAAIYARFYALFERANALAKAR